MRKERHVIYLTSVTAVALADYRARRRDQFRSNSETVEHLLQRALMGTFDEGMEGLVAPVLAQAVQQAAARAVEGTITALLATQTDRLAALLVRSDRDTIAAGKDAAGAFAVATAVLEVVLGDRARALALAEDARLKAGAKYARRAWHVEGER